MHIFFILQKNSKNSTSLLKVQFISRLKEAGEFLHNNVKLLPSSKIKNSKKRMVLIIRSFRQPIPG